MSPRCRTGPDFILVGYPVRTLQSTTTKKRKLGWRDLGDKRVALMLALGFSAGIPFLLVLGTLAVRLREAGVPVTTIGLFSWLAIAYSLKFIWSPVIDAFDVPALARLVGRRRAWMIACQLVVVLRPPAARPRSPTPRIATTAPLTFNVPLGSAKHD